MLFRSLKARGAVEYGRAHYPFIVALHAAWLITVLLLAAPEARTSAGGLALLVLLQLGRLWTVMTLGSYWSTRVLTLPGEPLVRGGPYRLTRHPNYLIVVGEIAALPLAFGEWRVALVFSALNAFALAWRIRVEDRALAPRREMTAPIPNGSHEPT